MSHPEQSRDATATIKGFFYQFDKTLIEILVAESNKPIFIEKVEDMLSGNDAIQVKYHEKQSFSNSIIAKPIALMLKDFVNKNRQLNYILYVHFKDFKQCPNGKIVLGRLNELIELSDAKKVLKDISVTETQKRKFLEHFKIEQGQSFDGQREQVLKLFAKNFSSTDSKEFVHPRALYIIHELAIKTKESERTITFSKLRGEIEKSKKLLFDRWFIDKKSVEKFTKELKAYLNKLNVCEQNKNRVIILGKDWIGRENQEFQLCHFIEEVSKYIIEKWTWKGKNSPDNKKPITFVIDASPQKVQELKKNLINQRIFFNDGYEHIKFSLDAFMKEPIHRLNTNKTPKVEDMSYRCRIISLNTFKKHYKEIEAKILVSFSSKNVICDFKHNNTQQIEINCSELSLSDLSSLLK